MIQNTSHSKLHIQFAWFNSKTTSLQKPTKPWQQRKWQMSSRKKLFFTFFFQFSLKMVDFILEKHNIFLGAYCIFELLSLRWIKQPIHLNQMVSVPIIIQLWIKPIPYLQFLIPVLYLLGQTRKRLQGFSLVQEVSFICGRWHLHSVSIRENRLE